MGKQWKPWQTPFSWTPKSLQMVTAAMKIKAPWKKSYDQPRHHIKKQRHYFANKGPSSQSYHFSSGHVWMRCWTIKKVECQRIDTFELWCWRRLLRVPWSAKRSNQSIVKEINLNIHWKDWCWIWNSNTLAHSFLCGPTLTYIHDYWKNHSFD